MSGLAESIVALANADFVAEHLTDCNEHRNLIEGFSVGKNAKGLENYLKYGALLDEVSNESRTYLVKDAVSLELACYFSLRSCLVPFAITDDLFTTIPAIELSNFASNARYRSSQSGVRQIGAYVFMEFVLPICHQVASLIGAKWLCIYALPETKLVAYYCQKLGFSRLDAEQEAFVYSHVKPKYDKGCIFMYQNL